MYESRRVKDLLLVSQEEHRPLRGNRVCTQVFYRYVPVASFYEGDLPSKKIAAIQLVESGLASIIDAAEVVGLHRNTVTTAINVKRSAGIESAIRDDRGRKQPIHYTPAIQAHVIHLLENHPDWTDTQIAQEAARDLQTRVSRQAVARIRVSHLEPANSLYPPSKKELMEIGGMVGRMEEQVGHYRQLCINFENEPELKKKVEEFKDEPTSQGSCAAEVKVLSRLEQGFATPYAGLFLYHLFVAELNFCKLFKRFDSDECNQYHVSEICLSIFFGLACRLSSIEAHKLLNPSQFGPLFGMPRSPDPITIRAFMDELAEQNRSESIVDNFALQVLKMGAVDPRVFFVDGHFLPYYGLSLLAQGYHTVRRQTQKGNEVYVVSDIEKRPLMFITEGCEIDFRPIIDRIADKIIGYGVGRPLIVFDRGGYGVHFFSTLSAKADFITWGKYVDNKELDSIQEDEFTVGFRFYSSCYEIAETERDLVESAGTANKDGREERSRINVRMVVIREIDERTGKEKGKRLPVFTCNKDRQSWEIAFYMLNRWGKSENFFKEIMGIFNFNYHPGYVIDTMEEQPLFENPKVKIIRKAIKALDKEIRMMEGDIAILQLEYQSNAKNATLNRIKTMEFKKQEKQEDRNGLTKKLEQIPEKVNLESLLGTPLSHCDLEKKRIYDLIQIIAYHARERLVDEFRHCYDRSNDVKQVLDKIANKGGHVRLIGKTVVVLLDWIERPAHRKAAEQLCHRINRLGIMMQGRLPLRLHFAVSHSPLILG